MKTLAYIIVCLGLLSSCSEQCNIAGNSTVSSLDGRMLYLRVSSDGITSSPVDSCEVVHGRFSFLSDIDSIMIAQLYMGSESMMPVVLESGNINVEVDHVGQRVTGGPFNDRLYKFIQKKNRLENDQWELDRKCMHLMHEGKSLEEINHIIGPKAQKLAKAIEELETKFIMDNYNNPLGPGCFMLLFSQYPLPIMTDQINRILNQAPSDFLQNPFVNNYIRRARSNARPASRKDEEDEDIED